MAQTRQGSGNLNSSRGKRFSRLMPVFDDVWWAWGTTRFGPGVTFPRNMTILRGSDGLIVVHPVLMPEEVQAEIEALGPIKHIVRLGAFHGMDDSLYVDRYQPTTWAPPGIDPKGDYKTDREIVPGGELPIEGAVAFDFDRASALESAIVVPRHGGILLTCDSVQCWEKTTGCSFLGGLMARAMGFRGRACIGPGWRKIAEPKDGQGFAPNFRDLLEHDFKHLISGHGEPLLETAKTDLEAAVAKAYGTA